MANLGRFYIANEFFLTRKYLVDAILNQIQFEEVSRSQDKLNRIELIGHSPKFREVVNGEQIVNYVFKCELDENEGLKKVEVMPECNYPNETFLGD